MAGDDRGSFLEILPATTVLDPVAPLGLRQRPATFELPRLRDGRMFPVVAQDA
jgi:hypothetical protein